MVGHAPCMVIIEAQGDSRSGPEIHCHERIDLSGMWNWRDETERPIRLIDTYPVVGLDAIQIEVNQLYGCDLFRLDRLLSASDARIFQMELGSRRLSTRDRGHASQY